MLNAETAASRALQLRGKIAESNIPLYIVAATVGVHPGPLGQMLLGRIPMPAGIAARIEASLARFQISAGRANEAGLSAEGAAK